MNEVSQEYDKTSIMFLLKNEAGALYDALLPFKENNVNISRIQSRPSRDGNWDYFFFIDLIGHIDDPSIKDSLNELDRSCQHYKVLGSGTMSNEDKGLYDKYTVTRNDNSEKHKDCRYFVLDMDHDKYAAVALMMYARMCREEYPKLADDLDAWAKEKTEEAMNDPGVAGLVADYFESMGIPTTDTASSKEEQNKTNKETT